MNHRDNDSLKFVVLHFEALLLIRPDGYICMIAIADVQNAINRYLEKFLRLEELR